MSQCVSLNEVFEILFLTKKSKLELPTCKSKKCELLLSTVPKPKKLKGVEKENILQAAKAEVIDC